MKKSSEIKEKIQITKKIYLVDIDKTIFWITLSCLLWILIYKLLLINIDPFFTDTYNISANIADITYTIFSSIIAASIFYIVTVFLPRCNAINNMRRNIVPEIKHINGIVKCVVEVINKENKNIKYTFDEFSRIIYIKHYPLEFEKLKNDFVNFISETDKLEVLIRTTSYLKSYIEPIYNNYSNILLQEIIVAMNDYKFRNFDFSNISEDRIEAYFMQLVHIITITNSFEEYYDLKVWNYTQIMQRKF